MSQIEKLQMLQSELKQVDKSSNLDTFDGLVSIYLGVEPKEHFPKVKDQNGKKVKDEKGNDLRSEISDGWTYTFSQFGTSKLIKVVLPKVYDLKIMTAYLVSGKGYDIFSGNMIFIESDGKLANY